MPVRFRSRLYRTFFLPKTARNRGQPASTRRTEIFLHYRVWVNPGANSSHAERPERSHDVHNSTSSSRPDAHQKRLHKRVETLFAHLKRNSDLTFRFAHRLSCSQHFIAAIPHFPYIRTIVLWRVKAKLARLLPPSLASTPTRFLQTKDGPTPFTACRSMRTALGSPYPCRGFLTGPTEIRWPRMARRRESADARLIGCTFQTGRTEAVRFKRTRNKTAHLTSHYIRPDITQFSIVSAPPVGSLATSQRSFLPDAQVCQVQLLAFSCI